ncbi:hypothetical protein G8S49_05775 [Clostridium botulinum C]|uniref:Uncharacterized protein n=2 Tax=Clostridium botulinum TaxID=1491 RepID=A0A9Q4XXQ9_CLOBO|nr:hypothetical protein [Clostridium botulinum]YP_398528.1 hypothetical protein CST098 [Clostridium phage c-st]MCD3194858.1 hypothetical protein [Clostridium botulinum C]MCD3200207.1 hypothetical protein [Clostridium botulinum C]MCD3205726.1 hypothetical protein [Clostridium botulinum C]MCD3207439.1 hypothetical protein [Clostridium botulinum C]MCD3226173.1 hypothetical protein [Clostridium botulinum C]
MINKNNIDKIQFIFENCESVTVPSENVSNFNIHINDNNEIDNLTITIKDDNNITGCVYDKIRPFTRFNTYNDIASVGLLSNNQMKQYSVIWDSTSPNENSFQHNELIDAYTLNININTYKPRFPYVDIEGEGKLIHINDREMIKVYDDFVMIDKELLSDICIKADVIPLYDMINNNTQIL